MSDYTRKQWMRLRRLRPGARWFFNDGTYNVGNNEAKRAKKPAKRMTQPKVKPLRKRALKSVIYLREMPRRRYGMKRCSDVRRELKKRGALR